MSRTGRTVTAVVASTAFVVALLGFPVATHASTSYAVIPGIGRFTVRAGTSQVIVVKSVNWRAATATVTAYEKQASGPWVQKFGPFAAHIGRGGMRLASRRHEGDNTTPAGVFALTTSFGRLPDTATSMPYREVTPDDYWVGDSSSPYYNELRSGLRGGFNRAQSEHLTAMGAVYDHAIVVDFNRPHAVAGRGSAIFLHITNGHTTSGCVAVSRASVVSLLNWLDPAQHPRIVLGPASWLAG